MKRSARITLAVCLLAALSLFASTRPTYAATGDARIRVVHASPDAPAVDVYVNGKAAFTGATFFGATDYAMLAPASYKIDVFAASANGQGTPAISVPSLALESGKDYTAVAYGLLNGTPKITVLPFADDNSAPAAGKAKVRFIHASPDVPAVDIAVTGGPVLFTNIASGKAGNYISVDAGTYNLEARPTGTTTAALKVPGVTVEAGKVYTVYAVGLLNGSGAQALAAKVTVDSTSSSVPGMPATGMGSQTEKSTPNVGLILAALVALVVAGFGFRRWATTRS